jgi:hypothetical protein
LIVQRKEKQMTLLGKLSWRVTHAPNAAKVRPEHEPYPPFTEWEAADMAQIVWPEAMTIQTGVDRDDDMEPRTVQVKPDAAEGVTLGSLLRVLYAFFNEAALEQEDIDEIQDLVDEGQGDMWHYMEEALEAHANGEPVHWSDLMGDAVFFEGLAPTALPNSFCLHRGS